MSSLESFNIPIIKDEKAGAQNTVSKVINLNFKTITKAVLRVTLATREGLSGFLSDMSLRQFTVNGDIYYPSNPFNSSNLIHGVGARKNSLKTNGENNFSFGWNILPLVPDGKINAWLEIQGVKAPLSLDVPTELQPQNLVQKFQDLIKENTPAAIAIIALVAIIILAIAYLIGRIPDIPNIPSVST